MGGDMTESKTNILAHSSAFKSAANRSEFNFKFSFKSFSVYFFNL